MKQVQTNFSNALSIPRLIIFTVFILLVVLATRMVSEASEKKSFQFYYKKSAVIVRDLTNFMALDPMTYGATNKEMYGHILNIFQSKYIYLDCENSEESVCAESYYFTMNGKAIMTDEFTKDAKKFAIGGMLFMLKEPERHETPLYITVDTNGGSGDPNRLGYDVFIYQLNNGFISELGAPRSTYKTSSNLCNPENNSRDKQNGITCAFNAAVDENYFAHLK